MKEYYRKIIILTGLILIMFILDGGFKYIFSLLITLIAIFIAVIFMVVKRNFKISISLFKSRFYWFYPLLIFFVMCSYVLLKIMFNGGELDMKFTLILAGISILIGLVQGFIEKRKFRGFEDIYKLIESADYINYDNEKEGFLCLNSKNEIVFLEDKIEIINFKKSDIEDVIVCKEYKIFLTYLKIILKDGRKYKFELEYPLLWKEQLL